MIKQTNFVEVPLRETIAPKWKELAINTGAAQSTLEDIKLAERAGGYVYQNTGSATRNRFIYWKTNNNVLELTEESLDMNLIGNRLRLRFQRTPLLEGVSIFETHNCVVVLAATVASVHRMSFPHPRRLNPDTMARHHTSSSGPSVFFDASVSLLRDYHVLNHVGLGTTLSQNSCSWLGPNGEAIFVLGTNTSALFVVSIDPQDAGGKVSSMEIRKSTTVVRLLNNILPTSMRGDGDEASISLVCHQADDDVFIFALSRDLRIRHWSYRRQDLLMMSSVLEHCSAPTSRSACMYKATDSRGSDLYLGVYVSFPEKSEFFLFRPVQDHGSYKMSRVATMRAPESDLVDFCLTSSCLWTLWVKQNDEPVVCMKNFGEEGSFRSAWSGVFLQRGVPPEKVTVPTALDAREIYLEKIFGHGAFSYTTLSKALGMYSRRGESGANPDFSCRTLRDEVVAAVEAEIRASATEVSEAELADVEYVNLALKCWGRFYHTCIQYHEVGSKPLGLFVDPTSKLTALIRRDHISMLRPCESLESLVLSEDAADGSCTSTLITYIKEINALLTSEMLMEFAQGLYNMERPESLATRLASQFAAHFSSRLRQTLLADRDLVPVLKDLIASMDLQRETSGTPDPEFHQHNIWNLLFTSMTGRDFVASCLCQTMRFRFTFCQDLLMLECLLLIVGNEMGARQKCIDIGTTLVPKTEALVQAYYVSLWATETEGSPVSSVLEGGINRLSLSNRSDGFGILCQNTQQSSLAWLFLRDAAGDLIRKRLVQICKLVEECELWKDVLPAYIRATAELIWPFAPEYAFAKTLLDLGQHLQLQEYVRLRGSWCKQNSGTCKFLLATSLLGCNEPHKACELFQDIAQVSYLEEPFLQQQVRRLVSDDQLQSERSLLVLYFLGVIKAFEQAGLSEYVVKLMKTALDTVEPDDPKIPTMWSLLFRCQLELDHVKEAYDAIIQNPDVEEQTQCLRQLVVVLCERRQLSTFVSFPFKEVINEVTSILKSRARSMNLLNQPYYDILYAMHVNAKRYREAAAMMYEYGSRLGQEVPGGESLRRQQLCLLAAINCLLLAKPEYAWITSPVLVRAPTGRSPKRDSDGTEVPQEARRKVEVIAVQDIRRELGLIQAWLLLVESGQEGVSTPLSPEETATLLVVNGHLDVAAKVCRSYQLDLDVVFEGLVSQCTRKTSGGAPEAHAIDPQWIVENPRAVLDMPGQAWSLLQHYLRVYEGESGITRYHRLVACQLLTHGCILPPWFLASYKARDPAELLRLYMTYGKLEEAADLAAEYVDATLGMGKEYFGLRNALHSTAPPVWLPHTTFDRLLVLLKGSGKMEDQHRQLGTRLQEYLTTLERVSAGMR